MDLIPCSGFACKQWLKRGPRGADGQLAVRGSERSVSWQRVHTANTTHGALHFSVLPSSYHVYECPNAFSFVPVAGVRDEAWALATPAACCMGAPSLHAQTYMQPCLHTDTYVIIDTPLGPCLVCQRVTLCAFHAIVLQSGCVWAIGRPRSKDSYIHAVTLYSTYTFSRAVMMSFCHCMARLKGARTGSQLQDAR